MNEKISQRPDGEWTLEEITAPYDEVEHCLGDRLLGTVVRIQDEDGTLIPIGGAEMNNGELFILVPSLLDTLSPEDLDAIYRKRAAPGIPPQQDEHPEQTLFEAAGVDDPTAYTSTQGEVIEVNRSAITGRFVSDEEADANPDTTTTEKVERA